MITRLPEHDASPPLDYRRKWKDSWPSTSTVRCTLCGRLIYFGMGGNWVHAQDLHPERFREAKWHLVTRHGSIKHFDVGGGKTACGAHRHWTVKPTNTVSEFGEFSGGWRRCKRCIRHQENS